MAAAPTPALPDLHPFADVAKTYGFNLRSMREAANRGDFDHVRVGHNLYFLPDQIKTFVELKTRKAKQRTRSATRDRVTRERQRRAAVAA